MDLLLDLNPESVMAVVVFEWVWLISAYGKTGFYIYFLSRCIAMCTCQDMNMANKLYQLSLFMLSLPDVFTLAI